MHRNADQNTAHVPRQAAPLQSRPHRYLHRLLTLAAGSCILLSTASLAQPVNGNGNATSANSHAATLPAPVAAALRAANIPLAAVAAQVQEIGAAQALLALNTSRAMNPASTMKLVTTFAGLDMLGPTFSWKTDVSIDGTLANGVLDGNLVFKGRGDPKLTIENLWLLAKRLRERGVRDIRGDLVLDRSAFEAVSFDAGRFDNDPTRPYNVGPDALLVNFKAVRFTFVPDAASGKANVIAEPRLAQLEVAPNVRLSDEACGDWRARLKADFQSANGGGVRAVFAGTYPASCADKTWNVALFTPNAFFDGVFRSLWTEMGGTLQGKVREAVVPAGARLLTTHESPPLSDVVRDINKFSNNVMARQLFLTLGLEKAGAEKTGQPARAELSAEAVRAWLADKRIELPDLVMDNGSGLSRTERITAAGMGRLLQAIYASSLMPEMMSSLPIVALDGTMRRRFKSEELAGQAHIKTGSLSDVRAIAGYVLAASGKRYAVVFFVNHGNAAQSQPAQDALLRWVHALGARGTGTTVER
jgi:D-alanyl-D-alanine carboxypeptidase/D-alanyl-D-alanine-endopeptidase (penicillin-binding protein 4)